MGELRCSFCAKCVGDVRTLIAGPDINICDECVALCNDILTEQAKAQSKPRFRVRADGWARQIKRWPAAEARNG